MCAWPWSTRSKLFRSCLGAKPTWLGFRNNGRHLDSHGAQTPLLLFLSSPTSIPLGPQRHDSDGFRLALHEILVHPFPDIEEKLGASGWGEKGRVVEIMHGDLKKSKSYSDVTCLIIIKLTWMSSAHNLIERFKTCVVSPRPPVTCLIST